MKVSKIKKIKKIDYKGKKVYDLSFDKDNLFFASSKTLKDSRNSLISSVLIHNSPPDIDIDFMSNTDHITDDFLIEKYGRDRVLSVGTWLTFNEKGCIKDVVRAHHGQEATGRDGDIFQVTKEMPKDFGKEEYGLKEWIENYPKEKGCSPTTKRWLTDPNNELIIEQTLRLQGEVRGFGQHAAGVVITPNKCWEDIPTNMIAGKKSIVAAFREADGSVKELSMLGILKLDRLKVGTLNVIRSAVETIRETKGENVQDVIEHIDEHFGDPNIYEEIKLGQNQGVFQFESAGMNALIRSMDASTFDELTAANALYRPAAMGVNAHTDYIKNKFHPNKVNYAHDVLKPILSKTNGVMLFQEQVMFIANKIGGLDLGEGDMLRRYMDKASSIIEKNSKGEELSSKERNDKNYKGFLVYWNKFLEGAAKQGLSEEDVNKIRDYMIKYLGYSFNKSHSVSYSQLAAQTLYLKHYYPTEFYVSLLNNPKASNAGKDEEREWLTKAIASTIAKGIKVHPPSRNSEWDCTIIGDKEISLGLSMINGLGTIAYEELCTICEKKGKKFGELTATEFFALPFSKFNKTAFDACLKAGLFDDWSNSREYLQIFRTEYKKKLSRKKKDPNQMDLFGKKEMDITINLDSSKYASTTSAEKLNQFISICGFDLQNIYRISNIRAQIDEKARKKGNTVEPLTSFHEEGFYYFIVNDIRYLKTKTNKDYVELSVGDGVSTTKVRIFDPLVGRIQHDLERKAVYIAAFKRNEKGFINIKPRSPFKKIVHANSNMLIED